MPTTLLDGEFYDHALLRRYREDAQRDEEIMREIMDDEIHKAVDTAFNANDRAMLILRDMLNELTKDMLTMSDVENSCEEFKYARIAGLAHGSISSVMVSANMVIELLLQVDAALRSLKGEL